MSPIIVIKITLTISLFVLIFSCDQNNGSLKLAQTDLSRQTVTFPSSDSVQMTADIYMTADSSAPFILLFHQAGYSRGEYLSIAPELNKQRFNCMAVDLRSGKEVNGIVNETHKSAIAGSKPVAYTDALPDIESSLHYIQQKYHPSKIILWGSSYSASLIFIVAAQHPGEVNGLLAFSPGEYFTWGGQMIEDYSRGIKCPVFITSAKKEKDDWKAIYDNIPGTDKTFYLPDENGYHGSQALWSNHMGNGGYWEAVNSFINTLIKNN